MAEENKETTAETTAPAAEEVEVKEEVAAVEEPENDTPFVPSEYLQMKIKLEDDSEAFLFSYGPKCKESGGNRPLNCHLCRVASLRDDMKKGHIQSKLHQRNLKRKVKPERYNKPYRQFCGINEEGKLMQFEINPGEDIEEVVPDEHKDRLFYKEAQYVRPKPDDLKVLKEEKLHEYNKTKPLLGLNYIFKMKSGEQIMYFCALCNLKLKGDAFLHIAGATHQASYIIKHFPNLYAKVQSGLEEIQNEVAVEHCTRNIFRYLYRKIENKKKRARINLVDFEYFQKNREEIVKKCLERNHFDENTIKFPKAELDILIRKSLKGIEFIKPDLKSLANPDLGFRTVVTPVVENQRPMMMSRNEPPPPKMRRPDLSGATPENWTAYRVMLGNMYDEINFKYKMFEKNPRSHPQHQYEWKMYLQQRIRELKEDNIDPRSHDIQSEWAPRWIQRLRQLYAKDLANRKRELKRLLNLPFDRSPSPIRQMDQPEPMQWQCEQQPQPPTPSQPMFGAPNMIQGRPLPIFTEDSPIVSSEPLSVISVMRLLSALEDQLGSLGPKAVQLLSRAVLCEKDSGNTEPLLLDNDYYVFFATVKEKFRGQLQANVVEFSKRQAISHCVNEITSILEIMEKSLAMERERRQHKEQEQQKRLQQQQKQEEQRQQQNQRKQQQQQQGQQQWQRGKPQQQGGKFDGGNQKNMGNNQWNNMNDSFGSGGFSGNNQKGNLGGGGDAGNLMNKQNRKRNAPGGSMPFGNNNNNTNRNFPANSKSFWQQGQGNNSGDNFSNSPSTGRFDNSFDNDSGNNFNRNDNDNFGRGGGNNNPGRNFNSAGRGNNSGGGMKNFNDNTFGGGRNFSGGNNTGGNNRNMDNRNDNFNRNFDDRNDSGNQGSTGGNFTMFSRNTGGQKNDNFGKSNFGSGGGGMSDNFGGNNRGFGGSNNNQNRGFGGNNLGRNNNSNNSREGGGGNLYSRRNDGGGNFGLNSFGGNNNNPSGNFNRPNNNFGGRMPGFNSNF